MRKLPVVIVMVCLILGLLSSIASANPNGSIMPPGVESGFSPMGADIRPW